MINSIWFYYNPKISVFGAVFTHMLLLLLLYVLGMLAQVTTLVRNSPLE